MIERVGGKDFILKRGAITYSPPPGVARISTSVERAGSAIRSLCATEIEHILPISSDYESVPAMPSSPNPSCW